MTTTTGPIPSSPSASQPPDFMTKVDDAKSKATREVAKEEEAQGRDEMESRKAALVKAGSRLVEQTDYLKRIDTVIEKVFPDFIGKNGIGEVVDQFVALEEQFYGMEEITKQIKSRLTYAREVLFPERMDREDTKTSTSSETGNRISRTGRVFASIINDKVEEAKKWLRDNGYGSIIKETVNSSSLAATAKELVENGKELPEEFFNSYIKDGVSITKGKKK